MKLLITALALLVSTSAFSQSLVRRNIECDSNNYATASCGVNLDQVTQIYLAQQKSHAACVQGQSYQISNGLITVSAGCRALFTAEGWTNYVEAGDQVLAQVHSVTVTCESQNYQTTTCAIPSSFRSIQQAYVQQQLSHAACIEGQTYSINDNYIQVSGGCRAEFVIRGY